MASNLAFVDVETTGLDRVQHEIWEVGLIIDGARHRWHLDVNESKADPMSLNISGFYERHPYWNPSQDGIIHINTQEAVWDIARLTRGRHLVGNCVSFDAERLADLLLAHRLRPAWHYHLVDVEALAAGKLGMEPPWDSEKISRALGVAPPTETERHTALGDCVWAQRVYEAVMKPAKMCGYWVAKAGWPCPLPESLNKEHFCTLPAGHGSLHVCWCKWEWE